ncbi:ATP-binding protein [Fundidesulfovibrio butyratiphilus]
MSLTRLTRTASFRLAALYAVLFALSASILFGVVYWISSQALLKLTKDTLMRESSALMDDLQSGGMEELVRSLKERLDASDLPPAYGVLMDASGRVLTGNIVVTTRPEGFTTLPASAKGGKQADEEEAEHGVIAFGRTLPGGGYLLVGEDRHHMEEAKEAILLAFGWGLVTTLLLAVGGGVLLSRGFLRRIDAINRTTRAIVAGNLADRAPTRSTRDELDQLAINFNAMLDRIQMLMDSLRQVSNDIAHDLRMPLHHLRQRLERARLKANTVPECHAALEAGIADADEMLILFSSMLGIARIEAGTRRSAFTRVNLSGVMTTIAEAYAPVAEDQGQTLGATIDPDVEICGDRPLLTQMFSNLVENAIRHCPKGTSILLTLRKEEGSVVATVKDNGPGIPAREWEHVFKRFYRLDRSRGTAGSGLGLALVKAVADLHGAVLGLSDAMPGLGVRVRFPAP